MTLLLAGKPIRPLGAAFCALLTILPCTANADFISLDLSGPGTISAGGSATFTASISDTGYHTPADGGAFCASYYVDQLHEDPSLCFIPWMEFATGVSYTFYSGDGQSYSGGYIPPVGAMFQSASFSHSFAYAVAGDYTPYIEVDVGGFYRAIEVGVGGLIRVGVLTTDFSYPANAHTSLTVAGVPEPETNAMMISGLALLGFILRRRNRSAR